MRWARPRGRGRLPPHFLKNCRKCSNFTKNLQNFLRFLEYSPSAYTSSRRPCVKVYFTIPYFYVQGIYQSHCWSTTRNVLSKDSVHVTVFSITRERKEIKTYDFFHWKQEILGHESMLKSDWSICWSIGFEHAFIVSNILLIKFSTKTFKKKLTKFYKEVF